MSSKKACCWVNPSLWKFRGTSLKVPSRQGLTTMNPNNVDLLILSHILLGGVALNFLMNQSQICFEQTSAAAVCWGMCRRTTRISASRTSFCGIRLLDCKLDLVKMWRTGLLTIINHYLTAFGVFRRPPWKGAILQAASSPCRSPARTWLVLKTLFLRRTQC